MKKLFYLFALILMGLSTACTDDGPDAVEPDTILNASNENLTVTVKEVQPSNISVEVTTKGLKSIMFLPVKQDADTSSINASYINKQGYKAPVPADGTYTMTIPDLQVSTAYYIFFSGITSDDEYCTVIKLKTETPSVEGVVNVFDIKQRAVKVHINLPESTVEAGNAFRWMFLDLATYNLLKGAKAGDPDAAMMVASFDASFPNYVVKESRTIFFDNEMKNMNVVDENGNPVIDIDDEGNEEYRSVYDPLVPGEVIVLGVGEYAYGHITEMIPSDIREKYQLGTHSQTGKDEFDYGYYLPLYDWATWFEAGRPYDEAKYWTGFYYKEQIKLEEPEVVTDGSIKFTVNKEGMLPYGGSFIIIPDAEIKNYSMVVMPDNEYQLLINDYLEGKEEHLRWFLSSWAATQIVYAFTYTGPYEFVFKEEFGVVDPNIEYHLLMTGYCNSEGSKQVFHHERFFLPDPTLPKPEVVVTALENHPVTGNPLTANEIAFNVKCTTKNAVSAAYACGYENEWSEGVGSYGSELSLIVSTAKTQNAYFSADDIQKMNSDEGYDMVLYSREDASSVLGVVAYNAEEAPGDAATCMVRSKVEDPAPRVESELFTELAGDWTATATIAYVPAGKEQTEYMELKSKVTLGDITYPADAPQEFKAVYANSGWRDMWNTYTGWADHFNEKTRNQNRILMQGFDFQVPVEGYDSDLRLSTPYDLMISETYRGYNTETAFWDFGPKWYLELQQDGSIGVPFNYAYFAPMSNWADYEYHLIAIGADAIYYYLVEGEGDDARAVNGYFPVEVSADKQTITVKPMMLNDKPYYPNAAYYSTNQGWVAYNVIYSDIVLTRGWTEPEQTEEAAPAMRRVLSTEAPAFEAATMTKQMTPIQKIAPVKKANLKVVQSEQEMRENGMKMLRKRGLIAE